MIALLGTEKDEEWREAERKDTADKWLFKFYCVHFCRWPEKVRDISDWLVFREFLAPA